MFDGKGGALSDEDLKKLAEESREEEKKEGEKRKRQFIVPNTPDKMCYANVFMVSSTLYDYRLDFGKRGLTEEMDHQGEVSIFMSPEHLKEMAAILLRLVNEYEESFGEIPSVYEIEATVKKKELVQRDRSKTFYN